MREYEEFGDYNRSNYNITHSTFVDTECINYVRNNSLDFSFSN